MTTKLKKVVPRKKPTQVPLATRSAHLNFENPTARSVFIAGSFNSWHPAATEMISLGNGRWVKELRLAPGNYEYRFVVDGMWIPDPKAMETVPNPFGGVDSVLRV